MQIIPLSVVVYALVLLPSYFQLFPAVSSRFQASQATMSGIDPSFKGVLGVLYS